MSVPKHPGGYTPAGGGSGGPGRDLDPLDDLDDEAPGTGATPRGVPIGRPVPEEVYERLKKIPHRAPRGRNVQQDPAVNPNDDPSS